MSDLHPSARALIEAAKRGEASFPPEAGARVHRSVLRRAAAFGAALATTSTVSAASKAGALVATLTGPLAIPGVVGAVAGVAFLVLKAGALPPEPQALMATAHPAPSHVAVVFAPVAPAPVVAAPLEIPSAIAAEPPPLAPVVATPLPAFTTSRRQVTPVAAPIVGPTAAAIESPAPPLAGVAAPAPGVAPAVTPTVATASASRVGPTTAAADLAGDLDRLRRVHEALRAGRAEAALMLLDREGQGLEAGPLAEEAQGARVSALCQLGRVADARAATVRFLAAWPASPLAMRLRGGCAAPGTNSKPGDD